MAVESFEPDERELLPPGLDDVPLDDDIVPPRELDWSRLTEDEAEDPLLGLCGRDDDELEVGRAPLNEPPAAPAKDTASRELEDLDRELELLDDFAVEERLLEFGLSSSEGGRLCNATT